MLVMLGTYSSEYSQEKMNHAIFLKELPLRSIASLPLSFKELAASTAETRESEAYSALKIPKFNLVGRRRSAIQS